MQVRRCPVQRERDHLLEGVLVGAVDVAARGEGVAVVVLVHPLVQRRPVHQPVRGRVEHVVYHEQQPDGDRAVEQAQRRERAADERREPEEATELVDEGELDERVDRKVRQVQPPQRVLVRQLLTGPCRQLGKQLAEDGDHALDAHEQCEAHAHEGRHPERDAQAPRVQQRGGSIASRKDRRHGGVVAPVAI